MKAKNVILLLFCISMAFFSSCNDRNGKTSKTVVETSQLKEGLEKANRFLVADEADDIDNYVRRHQLNMIETGSGLRYQIVSSGGNRSINKGDKISLRYELYSITGDLIYSSDKDGIKQFVVGDGTVESGLDEAVSYLHLGDKAKVIIPSHLAYGLLGDQKLISPKSTLIYSIEIIEIQ